MNFSFFHVVLLKYDRDMVSYICRCIFPLVLKFEAKPYDWSEIWGKRNRIFAYIASFSPSSINHKPRIWLQYNLINGFLAIMLCQYHCWYEFWNETYKIFDTGLVPWERFLDQTILYLDSQELATTGQKVITRR